MLLLIWMFKCAFIIWFWYYLPAEIYILLLVMMVDDVTAMLLPMLLAIILFWFLLLWIMCSRVFYLSNSIVLVTWFQYYSGSFLSLNCYAVLSNIQPNRKYTPTHTPQTDENGMEMEWIYSKTKEETTTTTQNSTWLSSSLVQPFHDVARFFRRWLVCFDSAVVSLWCGSIDSSIHF